ncbi:MAG: hypothetical protein IT179_05810 [Acidobacteria bacterium]|nr:hypothetical protein [Acidobacteriota bacterium]
MGGIAVGLAHPGVQSVFRLGQGDRDVHARGPEARRADRHQQGGDRFTACP